MCYSASTGVNPGGFFFSKMFRKSFSTYSRTRKRSSNVSASAELEHGRITSIRRVTKILTLQAESCLKMLISRRTFFA